MTEHVSTRRSYDAVATQYAAAIGDELRHKPLDRALLNLISDLVADGVVLDLGCGPGHVAAHLAERSGVDGEGAVGKPLEDRGAPPGEFRVGDPKGFRGLLEQDDQEQGKPGAHGTSAGIPP